MEQLQAQVIQAIGAILLALLGLLSAYIVQLINKVKVRTEVETAKIKDESQRQLINDALNRVQQLANDTVVATEQSIARELRESVKDGKIERSELVALGKQVSTDVYAQLTPQTKELLSQEITDIQSYIENAVEKALFELKNK